MAIYTIGHSTRTLDELVAILRAHGVRCLVDVRSVRGSRANPQVHEESLRRTLPRRKIRYVTMPGLGGRRPKKKDRDEKRNAAWENASFRNYADYADTDEFREALDALVALSKKCTCAIMCAEAVWWRCHRRIIADHLIARRVPVVHLMTETHAEPATLTPFAKRRGREIDYPRARGPSPRSASSSSPTPRAPRRSASTS